MYNACRCSIYVLEEFQDYNLKGFIIAAWICVVNWRFVNIVFQKVAALAGAVWCAGRIVYAIGYYTGGEIYRLLS